MIFAAISHVFGDLKALENVLADLDSMGVQVIVNTGDTVGIPATSSETMDLLESRGTITVQGAFDRQVARFIRKSEGLKKRLSSEDYLATEKCAETLSTVQTDRLGSYPAVRTLDMDGAAVVLCHGTWNRAGQYLLETSDAALFRRQRELQPAPIFVVGGPGPAYVRLVDGTLFVHPGPVHGENGAAPEYALISTETDPPTAELRLLG